MKKNEPITNIMSSEVSSLQLGQKLSDARKLMAQHGVHHIPILDGEKVIGLVSATDMMKIDIMVTGIKEDSIDAVIDQQFTIETVMSTDLQTIAATNSVREAAIVLSDGGFHSLPVVDNQHCLVGIVTSTDLIRYLRDQY